VLSNELLFGSLHTLPVIVTRLILHVTSHSVKSSSQFVFNDQA